MDKKILDYYLKFGQYTDPGLYKEILRKNLPDDNFDQIKHIWETENKFRILKGGLL